MVFQDTLFFLQDMEMNKPEMKGRYYSVLAKYLWRALIGQSNSSSQSPSTKSSNNRMENSTKQSSGTEGFWVLANKSGRKETVHDLHPQIWQTQKERPSSSLSLDWLENKKACLPGKVLIRWQHKVLNKVYEWWSAEPKRDSNLVAKFHTFWSCRTCG